MKASEAPEKIYIYPSDRAGEEYDDEWGTKPWGKDYVEYVRTDAFIEKAKEAFCKAMCNGHPPRSSCTSVGTCNKYYNFVKYMKGE